MKVRMMWCYMRVWRLDLQRWVLRGKCPIRAEQTNVLSHPLPNSNLMSSFRVIFSIWWIQESAKFSKMGKNKTTTAEKLNYDFSSVSSHVPLSFFCWNMQWHEKKIGANCNGSNVVWRVGAHVQFPSCCNCYGQRSEQIVQTWPNDIQIHLDGHYHS